MLYLTATYYAKFEALMCFNTKKESFRDKDEINLKILNVNKEPKVASITFSYNKKSSSVIQTGKGTSFPSWLTHLGVQLPAGSQCRRSTGWQCRTRTLDGAPTSGQNAASLPPQQGNGTRRRRTEGLGEWHRTAPGLGPKTTTLGLIAILKTMLSEGAQFSRSRFLGFLFPRVLSDRWGREVTATYNATVPRFILEQLDSGYCTTSFATEDT